MSHWTALIIKSTHRLIVDGKLSRECCCFRHISLLAFYCVFDLFIFIYLYFIYLFLNFNIILFYILFIYFCMGFGGFFGGRDTYACKCTNVQDRLGMSLFYLSIVNHRCSLKEYYNRNVIYLTFMCLYYFNYIINRIVLNTVARLFSPSHSI